MVGAEGLPFGVAMLATSDPEVGVQLSMLGLGLSYRKSKNFVPVAHHWRDPFQEIVPPWVHLTKTGSLKHKKMKYEA